MNERKEGRRAVVKPNLKSKLNKLKAFSRDSGTAGWKRTRVEIEVKPKLKPE
jgi:hypothetical protein